MHNGAQPCKQCEPAEEKRLIPLCTALALSPFHSGFRCHVAVSLALLRPPHLRACFMNKGGFWRAHSSGVRQGGAYEARQWVWGVKNAPRSDPTVKEALEAVDRDFGAWLKRYPFKRGDSPLAVVPDYERVIFDQAGAMENGEYWKQVGLNVADRIDDFADVPCVWLSGWYDIYARRSEQNDTALSHEHPLSALAHISLILPFACVSTIEFFTNMRRAKTQPHLLIMGPWQHVGPEDHKAGEADFGVNALISGNLAPTVGCLARKWFDRFVKPAAVDPILAAKLGSLRSNNSGGGGGSLALPSFEAAFSQAQQPHTSGSSGESGYVALNSLTSLQPANRLPPSLSASAERLAQGPALYILPSSLPRDHRRRSCGDEEQPEPMPPAVRYFRMGGGDGHRTSQGCMFHGGTWMAAGDWPPPGTTFTNFVLRRGELERVEMGEEELMCRAALALREVTGGSGGAGQGGLQPAAPAESGSDEPGGWVPHAAPSSLLTDPRHASTFDFDPRDPCPSIGGNVFAHRDVLLSGAYNQVERADMFLTRHREVLLPLSSRRDVLVFRTPPLSAPLDVTGSVVVKLLVCSSAVDTDFTAKLVDEYPPSPSYPAGFAMQVTHGIRRARMRRGDDRPAKLLTPGFVYEIDIECYPTSNLFARGHRLRLDISSSNFPHFDLNTNTAQGFESQHTVVAHNTVFHHDAYPSRIILPLQTGTLEADKMMNEIFAGQ